MRLIPIILFFMLPTVYAVTMTLPEVWRCLNLQNYEVVEASIKRINLKGNPAVGGTAYHIDVEYEYERDGVVYSSNQAYGPNYSLRRELYKKIKRKMESESKVYAFVNPRDASDAFLTNEWHLSEFFFDFIFLGFFALITLWALISKLKPSA